MQNYAANDLFNQAVTAIQAGERTRASDLFQQVLQLNPYAVEAWLWLAALTHDRDQRTFYLNQVLLLDPYNQTARDGLNALHRQYKSLLRIQRDTYNSVGKQTIQLQSPFGQAMLQSASPLPASSQPQVTRRSQGALKDALAQRKLVRFVKKNIKRRNAYKTMKVDFILEVMQRGSLTWQESVALINHIDDRLKKREHVEELSVVEITVFALGFVLSLVFSFLTGTIYGVIFMCFWPWIFFYSIQEI